MYITILRQTILEGGPYISVLQQTILEHGDHYISVLRQTILERGPLYFCFRTNNIGTWTMYFCFTTKSIGMWGDILFQQQTILKKGNMLQQIIFAHGHYFSFTINNFWTRILLYESHMPYYILELILIIDFLFGFTIIF